MKGTLPDRVRLGTFEVDLRAGELRQGEGAILVLPDQPLRILRMLIEANGEIVTREEIRERLWRGDTIVEFDHSINNAIKKLRRALVDSGDEPHYIGTIAKRGYRLLVPVERVAPEDDSGDSGEIAGPLPQAQGKSSASIAAGISVRDYRPEVVNLATQSGATSQMAPVVQVAEISGEQAILQPHSRPPWTWIAAAVAVCAVAIAGTLYWRAHRARQLTERDTIMLADFDNKTGDPVFDDTLKQALTIQLEQSPFLNLLSNRKIQQTLNMMNRSAKEPLTEDVSREICQRTGSRAMVIGSIAAFGREYVIGLRAIDCNAGDSLGEVLEPATGKEKVLNALDKAASNLRSKLGESLSSVEKYATPLSEATTPSLEALKALSLGNKAQFREGGTAALPYYQRAIELDPNFALAYQHLAVVYSNLNEAQRAAENGRKAYDLRDKVTERERLAIEATFYWHVTGELDKAAQVYEEWQQNYPRDAAPVGNLGGIYANLGNLQKFLQQMRAALRLEPNYYVIFVNLGAAYMNLNRLDDAEQAFKEAEQRGLAAEQLLQYWYQLAFLKRDEGQMDHIVAAAMGKPGTEDLMLTTQADTEAWFGRFSNARQLTQKSALSAERNNARETAGISWVQAALRESAAGNGRQARVYTSHALQLSQGRDTKAIAPLALAQSGDIKTAQRLAAELDNAFPLDTLAQNYWLPTIRAANALERKDPNGAVEALNETGPIELGVSNSGTNVFLCPAYVRGEAYLMLHDGKSAAAEFQKFIDHYGLITNFPLGALARLGVARAYALEAQTDPAFREKARTAYQNFLTLWKDADPDILIYKQAKAEYAKLN